MSEHRENVFIVNPTAGKGKGMLAEKNINEALKGQGIPYHIYTTCFPGDGEKYVRSYAEKNKEKELLFIACGGDGTLNEVVNGAAGFENVFITHYPCGSGNDFIKSLETDSAFYKDILSLLKGRAREINLIECSGRYCINICSVGIDARIAEDVSKIKKIPGISGSGVYIVSMLINIFKKINQYYNLEINGENYDGAYVIVLAANGSFYGGSFHPVPEANPSDGIIDFLMFKKVSRPVLIKAINVYKKGNYKKLMKYFIKLEGDNLLLKSQKPIPVNIDGEIIKTDLVDIKISPETIKFLIPQPPTEHEHFENQSK